MKVTEKEATRKRKEGRKKNRKHGRVLCCCMLLHCEKANREVGEKAAARLG